MYVDDLLRSFPVGSDAVRFVQEVSSALKKGGFHLSKCVSNKTAVISEVPLDDRADEVKIFSYEMESKALGLKWDVSRDTFSYVKVMSRSSTTTKRDMLSQVASLYDPLGLVILIVIQGIMLFVSGSDQVEAWLGRPSSTNIGC